MSIEQPDDLIDQKVVSCLYKDTMCPFPCTTCIFLVTGDHVVPHCTQTPCPVCASCSICRERADSGDSQ